MKTYFIRLLIFLAVLPSIVLAGGIGGAITQQITNQTARNVSNAISKNLASRIFKPQLKVRNQSGTVKVFAISVDERLLAILHNDNTVRIWDARQGVQRAIIKPTSDDISGIAVASLLNVVLLANPQGDIEIFDIYTGKYQAQLSGVKSEVVALSLSKEEQRLAVAYKNGDVVIWDMAQRRQQHLIHTGYGEDLTHLLIENNGLTFIAAGEDGFIDRWNIAKGEKVASLPQQDDDITQLWVGALDGLVASFDDDEVLQRLSGTTVVSQHEIDDDFTALALNQDLSLVALADEDYGIKIVKTQSLQPIKKLKSTVGISHLQFINNSQHLVAADKSGILHIYALASGEEILKLISTTTGWTVVDNQGRFDSSEQGMGNVSWVADEFDIPLDNFSGDYYEPGLLATQLEQQAFINQQPKPIESGIKLPPLVTITMPKTHQKHSQGLAVTVNVQGMGGGVNEINLYHNGKKVSASAEVDKKERVVDGLINKTLAFNIAPTAGTNIFKVIAKNNSGIEGHSEPVSITLHGVPPSINLHVVAIGINKYKDARLNLDYSVADGRSIADILNNKKHVHFDHITQHSIFDEQASKSEILRLLKKENHFDQNDIMVVYLAGHGLAIDGQWYFLPHETELKDSKEYYKQVGISAIEIQNSLAENSAQKILLMIDSCFSGASLQAFRSMQNSQRSFGRSVSKSAGIVVLAATRKDQEAGESSDLGHGLFTYVVTKGLNGLADLKPRNQQVSAHEIASYATETMPIFSKKYLGASQEPTAFSMGQDFALLRHE